MKQLFADVPDVLMVDDGYHCLRGEDVRDLLVACGASRYLAPQSIPSGLGLAEKVKIRKEAECAAVIVRFFISLCFAKLRVRN